MNDRRVWAGVVAGVFAALVVVSVAAGAFQAGQRHSEPVAQVVGDGGEVVRVVGGHGWGYGPGPGFFLFPLLGIVLVVLLLRGRGGGPGGWNRGCGPGGGYGGRHEAMEEWHRQAHGHGDPGATSSAPSDPAAAPREVSGRSEPEGRGPGRPARPARRRARP
ncbi:MAG: hypothetical protein QOD63_1227, partial [Actinomycetota bacterium]|nr:hypothetical protein [Actinomycetota bacterium]